MAQKLYSDDPVFAEWTPLNPRQEEFVYSKKRFVVGSGGKGGGKTVGLVRRAILMGIDSPYFGDMSGNIIILGRLKEKDFLKTTLVEFKKWLPRQWIRKEHVKDGILELVNDTVYHYLHLEAIDHLVGYNVGAVGIDQIEQIPEEVFIELAYNRIRLKTKTRYNREGNLIQPVFDGEGDCISTSFEELDAVLNYQTAFGVCNPRRCWIYDKFVRNEQYKNSPDEYVRAKYNTNYQLIEIPTTENEKYLPKGYIEYQRADKSSREFKRDVMGSWDVFEGQVFNDFTDDLILPENRVPHPLWDIYVGIDHGGTGYDNTRATNVTGVVFGALEKRQHNWDKMHIFKELYFQGSTIEETVIEIGNALRKTIVSQRYHYDNVSFAEFPEVVAWRGGKDMMKGIQDTSETIAARYMRFAALQGYEMSLITGSTDEHNRIEQTNWIFRKKLLDVNPSCIHFIESHRTVEYNAQEKIKAMQDDHIPEATGYMLSALPVWEDSFNIPQQEPTILELHIANTKRQENYEPDNIYGDMI